LRLGDRRKREHRHVGSHGIREFTLPSPAGRVENEDCCRADLGNCADQMVLPDRRTIAQTSNLIDDAQERRLNVDDRLVVAGHSPGSEFGPEARTGFRAFSSRYVRPRC
jgi:hypothetical protein